MNIQNWLSGHWIQIGVVWILVQNFLKALQDAIDAEPKGLQPIARIVYYMNAVGQYLFIGNRVKSITNTQQKVD